MRLVFNEPEDIRKVLENGFKDNKLNYRELLLVAKHYVWDCGYGKVRVTKCVNEFASNWDVNYNYVLDRKMINSAVSRAISRKIVPTKIINITEKELEFISAIEGYKYKKLLYMILVASKFCDTTNDGFFYYKRIMDQDVIKLSGTNISRKDFKSFIFELRQKGICEPSRPGYYDYHSLKVLFADNTSNSIISFDSATNVHPIEPFIKYFGEETFVCKDCKKTTAKTYSRQKRCPECKDVYYRKGKNY